jgi:hypothetical protein
MYFYCTQKLTIYIHQKFIYIAYRIHHFKCKIQWFLAYSQNVQLSLL